ncbi:MAG: rRNA pseudouridine synthase [Candidatus Pacebacteria bacterium]|jgi:pseudouridine synthase|nr:rRNA pseudouridine synthase [Candidatus Paceibacterota bacterium]
MTVRINKLLADLGLSSRRGADLLISAGKVKINDRKAKLGEKVDLAKDKLVVNGELINQELLQGTMGGENYEYWLLNKPLAVISAVSDPANRRTVMHFLKNKTQARLYPVGRLDYDSEGLLLMTNNGELTYRLTHPKYGVEKEYLVDALGIFTQSKIIRLEKGVLLAGKIAKAEQVELLNKEDRNLELKFILHEGRKREVRRLCARVGWEVQRLVRVRLGNLELGSLQPGTVRKLTETEITELKRSVKLA